MCPFCNPDPNQVFFETDLILGLPDTTMFPEAMPRRLLDFKPPQLYSAFLILEFRIDES